jgi:hypothetical protein
MKTDTTNPQDKTAHEAAEQGPVQSSRRRLIGGTAGGVGVLMAVSAKTALGTTVCQSPSAMISGNTSPNRDTPPPCSGGKSPGFWRNPQHFSAWAPPAVPATLKNVTSCPTGLGGIGPENIENQGTLISTVFGSAGTSKLTSYSYQDANNVTQTISANDWGLWAVLAFPKDAGTNEGSLLWHLCAAYLNSLAFEDYALTTQQVIDAGIVLLNGGLWCPSGMEDCGVKAMSASSFVAYISGMYDYNADIALQLCKKN